jgi:hypothetical protein
LASPTQQESGLQHYDKNGNVKTMKKAKAPKDPDYCPKCKEPAPIRAELFGFNHCEVEDHTAIAAAPVLAMCRTLIAAGYDPDRPLHAYRALRWR